MHPSGQTPQGACRGDKNEGICPEYNTLGAKRQARDRGLALGSGRGKCRRREGKLFHIGRILLPGGAGSLGRWLEEGTHKFEPHQMVTFGVRYPDALGFQRSGGLRKFGGGGKRGARDLEENTRGGRQGAAYSQEGTRGADVQRGRELQELFPFIVATANEYGDS